jgi:DNA-binding MarR family transcriptional regulator
MERMRDGSHTRRVDAQRHRPILVACMHATVPPKQARQDRKLVSSIGGFAKFILHAGGRDFYRAVGELELSISQIRILHLLTGPTESASLKTIADEVGLSMPAVSRSVDGLVQRGLVTRTEDAKDRRLKAVRATGEARELADRLIELRVAGITDFVETLSAQEREALAKALDPIVAREEIAPLCIARKDSDTNA